MLLLIYGNSLHMFKTSKAIMFKTVEARTLPPSLKNPNPDSEKGELSQKANWSEPIHPSPPKII